MNQPITKRLPSADTEILRLLNELVPVSRETIERLEIYQRTLAEWQQTMNLVAPATLDAFWTRHVADSLQVLALAPDTKLWIDLGSGAGFPGLAIAIANAAQRERQHVLVESNHKKCAFLRAVARQTGGRCQVENARIESVAQQLASLEMGDAVVMARALAPLPDLLGLALPMLAAGARGLFHKGAGHEREIEESRSLWDFDLVVHADRIEPGSAIVEIGALRKKQR